MEPALRIGGPWATFLLILSGLLGIPVAVDIAILRHHLYDIHRIINRTLVYGILTAAVVGSYALVVGASGVLLQSSAEVNLLLPVAVTGLIAVLFTPVRNRLQLAVDRLMYGERDDPFMPSFRASVNVWRARSRPRWRWRKSWRRWPRR